MRKAAQVLHLIHDLNETFDFDKEAPGACLKFHLFLKRRFPEAVGWYNSEHVITEIDEVFFDIDGRVDFTTEKIQFLPIADFGMDHLLESFCNAKFTERQLETLAITCKK